MQKEHKKKEKVDKIIQISILNSSEILALSESGNLYTRFINSNYWTKVASSPKGGELNV